MNVLRSFCYPIFIIAALIFSTAATAQERPNVLLLCIDDLRPELGCYGKDYIVSPHIDSLAARGTAFTRHYVQAPTCGASRFTLLTGRYGGASNNALFARAARLSQDPVADPPSMPAWFRQHGYTTVSVGKVSHHPGGRGGTDWDSDEQPEMPLSWDKHLMPTGPWQHPRGSMHGLARGEIRADAKDMDVFQSADGPDTIYPDGLTTQQALLQLDELVADKAKPFFLAVGIIRPHLPFGAPRKYLDAYRGIQLPAIPHPNKPDGKTTWHGSGEFMKYHRWNRNPNTDPEFATEVRRHYAACVTYADAQVGQMISRLEALGVTHNTIVVLWGDHGWHLGEHAIWGKHALFEESLRSPLIISADGLPNRGRSTDAVVETLDIFPTLCDLAGVPAPEFTQGESLRPIINSPDAVSHDAVGHDAISYSSKATTIRTPRYRLIAHKDGSVELYDHASEHGETRNVAADQPDLVTSLRTKLQRRLGE
jgi:iduronate 2-sulfatase